MKQHLRLDIRSSPGHAIKVMADLGITYQHATPQSMAEQWWFWNCENAPNPLPAFLSVLDIDPRSEYSCLTDAQAAMIENS